MKRALILLLLTACDLPHGSFDLEPPSGLPLPIDADERPRLDHGRTARPPSPVAGGTLAFVDPFFVVADPDRDRVLLVHRHLKKISYEINDVEEPGRVLVGRDGRVHVLLRGAGAVLSFYPRATEAAQVTPVCGAPRGLAEVGEALWVACAGGALYAVEPGHDARSLGRPAPDLRDLVSLDGRVFASRFRTAEVLELSPDGGIRRRLRPVPAGSQGTLSHSAVGWRLQAVGHRLALLHQVAHPDRAAPRTGGYGGPDPCAAVVLSAVSIFDPDDATPPTPMLLGGAPLAVDLAADGAGRLAFAAAGQRGPASARRFDGHTPGGCAVPAPVEVRDGARFQSVTRFPSGFAYLSLDPLRLEVVEEANDPWSLDLPGPTSADAGHNRFHDATQVGMACASCHPEGGDDGVVWSLGAPRRTQFLLGGLDPPFHWVGDLADLDTLMADVLTERMRGGEVERQTTAALAAWLDAQPVPVADPPADLDAVARGQALFFGAAACSACHLDGDGVDGRAHDVGTGEVLQTPALRHLAARTAFLHTGCAATLADRFRPECGGDRHGATADLSASELADLIAYLETL